MGGSPTIQCHKDFRQHFPKNIKLAARQDQFHQINIVCRDSFSVYILFVRKPIAMTAKDKIALTTFPDVAPLLVLPPLPVQLPYFLLPPQMCHNTGWHSVVFQVSVGQLEITTKT